MTLNPIGYIGAALFVGGLIGFGMLIENWRGSRKPKPRYRHRYKPRPVPAQEQEWSMRPTLPAFVSEALEREAQPVTPSEMFEDVCRKIVEESPEKFK